jgi:oxygen-independent coproporphyrinogen-3 oxidase
MAFAPPHLSLYHLTMEPNTLFAKYPPPVPDDDASADMQDMIAELTAPTATSYEVSAYAKAGRRAPQSQLLGIRRLPGHRRRRALQLSFPHRILRQARYKQPQAYMEQVRPGAGAGRSRDRPRCPGL